MLEFIVPDWPAPQHVKAYSSLRCGGISQGSYSSLNLGSYTPDSQENIQYNRRLLSTALALPSEPYWLKQVHGIQVVRADTTEVDSEADASYTQCVNTICVVQTADCLPIFLCDKNGTQIAAIHAGWRGLAAGIIETTLRYFTHAPEHLLAWLGPAIGPTAFVVGNEVRNQFLLTDPAAEKAFTAHSATHWLANIYELAKLRLYRQNVTAIYGGQHCTVLESEKFFSYRRDGQHTGRMAHLIWLQAMN